VSSTKWPVAFRKMCDVSLRKTASHPLLCTRTAVVLVAT
jgi:hypothetical protein